MDADPRSEKRSNRFYVPRDECLSEIERLTFSAKTSVFSAASIGAVSWNGDGGQRYWVPLLHRH